MESSGLDLSTQHRVCSVLKNGMCTLMSISMGEREPQDWGASGAGRGVLMLLDRTHGVLIPKSVRNTGALVESSPGAAGGSGMGSQHLGYSGVTFPRNSGS